MFDASTISWIKEFSTNQLKCSPFALQAVCEVESNGQPTALVKGKQEPLVRWEGHYFDARLTAEQRVVARRQGLASPVAGGVKNPASQAARWEMIARAALINRQAALESFSIGLGQVMTANWRKLGFASVDDLIKRAREDVVGQIDIMVRFIVKKGLADELQRLDFAGFARGYNGPAFKKNQYDKRMAAAFYRLSGTAPVSAAVGMLRMGSRGAKVRELQTLLVRAGYAVKVDGDYGPSTRDAVRDFQKAQRVTVDGVVGPETYRMLESWKQSPAEQPGQQAVMDVPEVQSATKSSIALTAIVSLRDKVAEVAGHLVGIDSDAAQTIANVLLAGAGVIGVGLAVYGIYGVLKSRKTDEGDVSPTETVTPAADGVLA